MPRPSRLAALIAAATTLAPLVLSAQETTLPGEAIRRATEAAEQGGTGVATPDGEPARTLGERLQDAAEMARDAAAEAIGASPTSPAPDGAAPDAPPAGVPATPVGGVGLDGRRFLLAGETVLSGAVLGHPVMTSDGVEAGTIRDLILSRDLRVEGIVLNTGVPGVGGRNIAIGADRLLVRDVVSGVPRLEVSATKAALDTTPDFAPGTAP